MLKIRDGVDLKELEKFGFFYDYDKDTKIGEWKKKEKFCEITIDFQRYIYIYIQMMKEYLHYINYA